MTDQLFFGADFWVMHLPLLPVVVLCFGLFVAGLAKGVSIPAALVLGPGFAARRPFLMTGVLCAALFALSWGFAANL